MNTLDRKHSGNLRDALQKLYHSGPNGFEGLLAIVLGHLTGQSFRLASSGTQRGRDGDSAFDGGATYFEGKRYKTSPDKKEISAKLYDLAIDDVGQVDLWVLGATCEVAAQTVTDARNFAARIGIGIVTLDWSDTGLGALLIGTVAAGDAAKTFIADKLSGTSYAHMVPDAIAAIDYFSVRADMPDQIAAVRTALLGEQTGLGNARTLNHTWLEQLFKSRVRARAEFGQPLAPLDPAGLAAIHRPQQSELLNAFSGRPASELYAVVGEEGVGKSWICAHTWLQAAPRSLLLICTADELLAEDTTSDFEEFLIAKLIRSTGAHASERALERWRRRIRGWRANPVPDNVRVTLVIDGLNQPRKGDWSRWIDRAATELSSIGGCVVVTTRSAHWTSIRQSLLSKVTSVTIAPWSTLEVKALLTSRSIDAGKVRTEVLNSLRNPRLLGLAVDLLEAKDVEIIGQLSVGRLIFEHMRKANVTGAIPLQPGEFAELLKQLAAEVLDRLKSQSSDDLRLFNAATGDALQAAASSRFFEPVAGSSSEYQIRSEGLDLGLAIYLISALSKEDRNKRDPRNALVTILEPIAALDEAAKVVFLATQIACLQDDISIEVKAALLEHLVSLQNLPTDESDAFAVLVKKSPAAFLSAMENVHCARSRYTNADWLLYALMSHSNVPVVWREIASNAKRWLSFYSLAPERMMFKTPGQDSSDEVEEEREKRQQKLAESTANLTEVERSYIFANLIETNRWDFDPLLKATFFLLAGKPLVDFAPYFMRFSFSDAYGPTIHSADKEFRQLIRFNRVDWKATREALLTELEKLPEVESSHIGKWARVEVLRATGALDDGKKADLLAEWLVRDRERFPSWSLRENYCATDPCDPASAKADNVDATAQEYRDIDPTKLLNHMGHSEGDHFFNLARCGVARFHLADAITAHRALANDVLGRSEFPRRQGVLGLLEHSSILTPGQAKDFLVAGQSSTACYKDDESSGKDEWLTAQYSVRLAIPHLSPDEQLEAIADVRGDTIILNTLEQLRPASEARVESVLENAIQAGSVHTQAAVLGALIYSKPPMSARVCEIVAGLCKSDNAVVRGQALGVAAVSRNPTLLSEIVKGGWDARKLASGNLIFESWYGSSAIVQAAKLDLLSIEDALDRMHLSHYGFAAIELGPKAATAVVPRIDAAIRKAISYVGSPSLPGMATTSPNLSDAKPPLMSLEDPPPRDQREQWDRFGETSTQFDERQKHLGRTYQSFTDDLTAADADLILADLTYGGVKALVEADSDAAKRWLWMFDSVDDIQLRHLHHVALQIGIALSVTGDATAAELVRRAINLTPTIRRVSGAAKLPAEALLVWANADTALVESICKRRLVSRHRDSDIALEVLAASLCGRQRLVEVVVDELLVRSEPIDVCLALTLSGFSDTSDHASAVLVRFEDAQGFIGQAYRGAKAAYERNIWSKVWFRRMRDAKDRESFWQASMMLSKIVDARLDVWSCSLGSGSEVSDAFELTVKAELERRIEKWQKEREKKLFGDATPSSAFLSDFL